MSEIETAPLITLASLVTDKVTVTKDPSKPYVGLEHIPSNGSVLLDPGSAGDSISTNNVFKTGDILFGKLRPGLRKSVRVNFAGYCSTDILVLRPNDPNNAAFVSFVLRSEPIFMQAVRTEEGTKMPRCSWKSIKDMRVFCPRSFQQRRIAEILSTVDEAIEQTEALIAKYQQIKAGLMHDLFARGITPDGHLRPTHAHAPHLYKRSPLGWIPKEWAVNRLGAILKQCGGYLQTGPFGSQLHAHEYEHEGVPVVMPQDINDGVISTDQIARIVERKAEELSRHRMRVGDMVIARRGELSRAAAIAGSHEGWLCGTGCFLLRLGRSALHSDFAACVYRHDLIQRQIAGMAVGTTMPSLNNTVMERLFFPFCDPEEQSRITERLDNLDQFLRLVQCQVAKLRQQMHGLMHDLLTGRVRVKVGEPAGR